MNWLDEAIEFRADQIADDVGHRGIFGEPFENRIAMEPEHFADIVLGVSRKRIRFLFRHYEYVRNALPSRVHAADLDHPRMHRATVFNWHEAADDEEPSLVPITPLFERKHRAPRPRYALSLATAPAIAVPAKNSGSALR